MWLKYRLIILAVLALAAITGVYFLVKDYNDSLRTKERVACNADWTIKNAEAEKLFKQELDTIRQKQKVIKPAGSVSDFSNELSQGKAFNPFGG